MTLICGYREADTGDIWIGGDSRGVNGSFIAPGDMQKLHRAGEWWIGCAGNASTEIYLRRAAGRLAACGDVDELAVVTRDVLHEARFRDIGGSGQPGAYDHAQEMLVARAGQGFWLIEPDGSLLTPRQRFLAIGRAQDVAYGAATVLMEGEYTAAGGEFLQRVLSIGARFYASVGPPYWIERVG